MRLSDRYGSCIPINMRSKGIYISSDIEHTRRVLVDNVYNHLKYFDGVKPTFGKAMITVDGALWQKIRQLQQPHFHPHVYTAYLRHPLFSIRKKMDEWSVLAGRSETFELLEETWGLWPAPLKRIRARI